MTRRVYIVLALHTASCYRTPPVVSNQTAAPRAPEPRTQRYCQAHEIGVVCDQPPPGEDMCPEKAEDMLEIRELPSGTLAVAIELVRTNGHTCTFEGELLRAPPHDPDTQRWTFSGSDEEFPCTLELVRRADEIIIRSTGCRENCGVRAMLDAEFNTASSSPCSTRTDE